MGNKSKLGEGEGGGIDMGPAFQLQTCNKKWKKLIQIVYETWF